MPRCSILMPAYQAGAFLGQAIRSVLAQGAEEWELLIGDNASTDDTPQVVASCRDSRIRYLRRPRNLGYVGNVRNLLAEAAGPYAVILCADDVWEPEYLAKTTARLDADPHMGLVHTGFWFQEEGRAPRRASVMRELPMVMDGRAFQERLFFGGGLLVALSSALFRREWALRVRAFEQEVFHTDTALWLKLAWLGRVGYCAEPLATYRWHPNNLSNTTARLLRLEQWLQALDELFAFAQEQGIPVEPSWKRAVMETSLRWCAKDAPNVKIASQSNRDVARLVRMLTARQPTLLLRPSILARLVVTWGASPRLLQALRRWHERWSPSTGFQLPLDQGEPAG